MPTKPVRRQSCQHLTDIEIAKALGLGKAKVPQREIAEYLGCSQKAVQHALATYDFDTFNGRNPRREYKRKTTEREDRYIQRALKQNQWTPLQDISSIVNIPVSRQTIARRRDEADLGSYIAVQKPGLRPENIKARLEWALRYQN